MTNALDSGFRVGDWIVLPEGEGARALHLGSPLEFSLGGAITRIASDDAGALRTLGGLGAILPESALLASALREHKKEPLQLGSILGTAGFSILFLELTGQCNERCVHCYAESSPERGEHLSLPEVLGVVDEAAALGVDRLQLTGGDPLVSKTYLQAASRARQLNIPSIEFYTNGLGLTDRVADELAELNVEFAISFFSHRPEVHDAITQTPGSQERTLRAIERALARGSSVRIGLISLEQNRSDVPETIELLVSLGIPRRSIGIDQERGVGRGEFVDAGSLLPFHLLSAGAQDPRPSDAELVPQLEPSLHGARGAGGKLCVSYTGDVYPCIFNRSQRLGSIRSSSLQQILEAPVRRRRQGALKVLAGEDQLGCGECQRTDRILQLCQG